MAGFALEGGDEQLAGLFEHAGLVVLDAGEESPFEPIGHCAGGFDGLWRGESRWAHEPQWGDRREGEGAVVKTFVLRGLQGGRAGFLSCLK